MHRALGFLKNLRIHQQMVLAYLVLVFTPILLFVAVSSTVVAQLNFEASVDRMNQALGLVSKNLDTIVGGANDLSKLLTSDDAIQELYRNGPSSFSTEGLHAVQQKLTKAIVINSLVSSIYLYSRDRLIYELHKSATNFLSQGQGLPSWLSLAAAQNGGLVLTSGGQDLPGGETLNESIVLSRRVIDLENLAPLGFLVMTLKESVFSQAFGTVFPTDNADFSVVDTRGRVVVHGHQGSELSEAELATLAADRPLVKDVHGQARMFLTLRVAKLGWTIVGSAPVDELSRTFSRYTVVTLIVLLLSLLVFVVGSLYASRLVTNPLRELVGAMGLVKETGLREVSTRIGNRDTAVLVDSYNRMIREIDELIQAVVDKQKSLRLAELNLLQEQIKPHFLYNTLNSICSLIVRKDNDRALGVLISLASFYRNGLSDGREVITVAEELTITEAYLMIQKTRYHDLLRSAVEAEPEVRLLWLPKLTLQPLVENAIYHGILPKDSVGTVTVRLTTSGGKLVLSVEDDGVGMTEDAAAALERGEAAGQGRPGFGLQKTVERLRLFYDDQVEVSVTSRPGRGTRITVVFPAEIQGTKEGPGATSSLRR